MMLSPAHITKDFLSVNKGFKDHYLSHRCALLLLLQQPTLGSPLPELQSPLCKALSTSPLALLPLAETKISFSPSSPVLPQDPVGIKAQQSMDAKRLSDSTGQALQGSFLPPLFLTLFWELPPWGTRTWWFVPRDKAGKGQGCSKQPEALSAPAHQRQQLFVQEEQEPLIHIWCQHGLYQHAPNFCFNPISPLLAPQRDRRAVTHADTETEQGQKGKLCHAVHVALQAQPLHLNPAI